MARVGGSGKHEDAAARTSAMGRRFWEQAGRDMEAARVLLTPRTYFATVFHAQQAAEKALKGAYWHLLGEEPAWRHELVSTADRLAERVGGLPPEVGAAINQIMTLFERGRYPSNNLREPIPADLLGEEDAEAAIRSAEAVMAWVEMLLREPPGKPGRTRRKTR